MRRPAITEREQAEARARARIEARDGHPLSADEWQQAKSNLKGLFGFVVQWQVSTTAERPSTPRAEAIRKRR